jgi:hypothetical protein
MRLTVAAETPTSAAICAPVWRCRRKASTLVQAASPVWLGDEWGRDERSCKPATPPRRKRATHLATVFDVVWNARAAAAFDRPPSITLRAIASRPFGVRAAFLCVSIRLLRESLRFGDISVHGSNRMDNLLKAHS